MDKYNYYANNDDDDCQDGDDADDDDVDEFQHGYEDGNKNRN